MRVDGQLLIGSRSLPDTLMTPIFLIISLVWGQSSNPRTSVLSFLWSPYQAQPLSYIFMAQKCLIINVLKCCSGLAACRHGLIHLLRNGEWNWSLCHYQWTLSFWCYEGTTVIDEASENGWAWHSTLSDACSDVQDMALLTFNKVMLMHWIWW